MDVFRQQRWQKIKMLFFIYSFVAAALDFSYVLFIGWLIQSAYEKDYFSLTVWIAAVVACYIVQECLGISYNYAKAYILPGYHHKMRGLLLVHWFQILPKRKMRTGSLSNALFEDMQEILDSEESGIASLTYGTVSFIACAGILFWIHWIVGLASLGTMGLGLLLVNFSNKPSQNLAAKQSTCKEQLYGASSEIDANKLQYSLMRLPQRHLGDIMDIYKKKQATILSLKVQAQAINTAVAFIFSVSFIAPIVIATLLYGQQNVTYSSIAMLVLIAQRVVSIGDSIGFGAKSLVEIKFVKRKYEINEIKEIQTVEYTGYSPVYEGSSRIFQTVNMDIEPGKKYLIKGPNGSGKSSAVGIFDTEIRYSGQIRINGNVVSPEELSAYMTSRPAGSESVFDSISGIETAFATSENVLYRRLLEVIKVAGVNIADPRDSLSQGERQLLSLMHSVATGTRFLIVDESLSSVAPELRRAIYSVLLSEQEMTVVVIDHSLDLKEEGGLRFDRVYTFKK